MFTLFSIIACKKDSNDTVEQVDILVRPENEDAYEDAETEETEDWQDLDGDGFTEDVDCDDWNPNIHPGAQEVINNEDDDCDGYVDVDGIHSGRLELDAIAIYQGIPYAFEQECLGEVSRIEGQLQFEIYCEVDQSQEKANMLLGEDIVVSGTENFVFTEASQIRVEFRSSGGEQEWTAQGTAVLDWSSFTQNLGQDLSVFVILDALYLDVELAGVLTRQ